MRNFGALFFFRTQAAFVAYNLYEVEWTPLKHT